MRNKRGRPAGPPHTPGVPSVPTALDHLLSQAFAHYTADRLAEAETLCRQILAAFPNHAVALHLLGVIAYQVGQIPVALELIDGALQSNPQSAEIWNHRGAILHALRRYPEALASYDRAIALNPSYADAHNNRGNTLHSLHRYQEALAACDRALAIRPDHPEALNNRRNALQSLNLANPNPSKLASSGRDLVFYCGPGGETWNPDTVETTGIGGSEEAVLWLSRLLHQRGWNVTVYADCGAEEKDYDGVSWKPYWMWNYRDKQDITVIWRYPQVASCEINSDKVILDLHDVMSESQFTSDSLRRIYRIFVKSRFHRSLYPHIPDEKFVIAPNGIDAKVFEGNGNRDPLLLINTSAADRSLEAFVDCFEEIKKQVPLAKAQWAYGWSGFDSAFSSDPQKMEWKIRIRDRLKELGVEERGRISHAEVAEMYRQASIFAYPSEFAEIDCISLSKAMAAGAIPITTDFAALGEKSGHGGVFIHSKKTKDDWTQLHKFHFEMTDPEQKSQFVREAVKLLLNPPSEAAREPMREWAKPTFDWNKVADCWNQVFVSQSAAQPPASLTSPTADQLLQEALAHHRASQLSQAEALYRQILQSSPDHFDALHLLGVVAHQVGRNELAIQLIGRAIRINPNYPDAYSNRGVALDALRQFQAALEDYDKAILLRPASGAAYSSRGGTLAALQRYQEALESCDRAIQIEPGLAAAYSNRAIALHGLGQYEAALESSERAIQLKPDFSGAHTGRGNALHVLQRYQEAVGSYDKTIQVNPHIADVHNNRAAALLLLRRYSAALESCDRAIQINPDFAEAFANRGSILFELQDHRSALESFQKAILLKPGLEYLPGLRLHMKRSICNWEDTEDEVRDIEKRLDRGERVVYPFVALAVTDSPAVHRKAAEIYACDKCSPRPGFIPAPRLTHRERIRIGYFSTDFYNHATSYLMAELFERHDRNRFEVLGFSFGPDVRDEMRDRVSAAMDRFIDVRDLPDRAIAQLSRKLEVDMAIDLKGFTNGCRPGIFAERAAPIQVSYLGYPGTMGADCMDYLIADHTLIPEADQRHYSEKIVYLPDCYQANDRRRGISAKPFTRAGEGLPENDFVYCCFNNNFKIVPDTFAIWMRILNRVEGSVLWLLEDNPSASTNLRKEAERRGIAPERLIFAGRLPLAEHLARHRLADLSLDTLPYNAHTTASDALWAGLPVLTCMGNAFAGRVAASILRAIDLSELITTSEQEYQALAIELALDRERLFHLRERLDRNRLTSPLFDSSAFTCHLEAAYTAMYARLQSNLPPDHIQIARPLPPRN